MIALTMEEIDELARQKGKSELVTYSKEITEDFNNLAELHTADLGRLKAKDQDISNLNNEIKTLEKKCKHFENLTAEYAKETTRLNSIVKEERSRYDTALEVMQIFAGSLK